MQKKFLWWKDGIIYQIYPRSFQDSNGDGIGDIKGIISRLDYLEFLGIDAIWLSPVNQSPMDDFGYDVKCYRTICDLFGTEADFELLIKKSHEKNIKIIMDLVLNHTSDHHIWFLESRSSINNYKRNWYIWHKGIKKGKKTVPPNNWLGAFGGSAWEFDDYTQEYYLHSFLKEQPDLNWQNTEVQNTVMNELKYWLDKGIDGFRLDVANWYVKDDKLRNNPWRIGPIPRPYEMQNHIYDRNRPETHNILKRFRVLLNEYREKMIVGEIFSEPPGNQKLSAEFYGNGNDELHLSFDFSFMYTRWDAGKFMKNIRCWYDLIPDEGWPCFVFSNHDQKRSITRFGGKYAEEKAKVLAVIIMTLKGTPFLYYGEEIGIRSEIIKRKDLVDPLGKKYWPFFRGRDFARTPMQWDKSDNSGFSDSNPWLPLNSNWRNNNVEMQKKDPTSLLNFYRDLISIRRREFVLIHGDWEPLFASEKNILCYKRKAENYESIFILTNFSSKNQILKFISILNGVVIYGTHRAVGEKICEINFKLNPFEAVIIKEDIANEYI